ncbi:MAG: hypothetical protein NT027_02275, partial [Proteobacteria bacterium]|nr:hypothetical protein [Pseudomonadota bacterium]
RRIKTETMDQSNRDSNLSLDLINTQENSLSLKSLTVKMNGSLLYNQIDHSGMWLPNSTLPLYNGPIQPGNHALDFTIVVATIKEQGLPLHGWSTQEITRKMQVEIPEGKSSRQIKILLKKESNNQISAELQDMIDGNNSNKKALK